MRGKISIWSRRRGLTLQERIVMHISKPTARAPKGQGLGSLLQSVSPGIPCRLSCIEKWHTGGFEFNSSGFDYTAQYTHADLDSWTKRKEVGKASCRADSISLQPMQSRNIFLKLGHMLLNGSKNHQKHLQIPRTDLLLVHKALYIPGFGYLSVPEADSMIVGRIKAAKSRSSFLTLADSGTVPS